MDENMILGYSKFHSHGCTVRLLHPMQQVIESFLGLSSVRPIKAAEEPQGSCLSQMLFALFVNDMPVIEKAKVALFAGDIHFISHNQNAKKNDKASSKTNPHSIGMV